MGNSGCRWGAAAAPSQQVADLERAYAVNVRTGESFNDLPRAISLSLPGDTFELSGHFKLNKGITVVPRHPLSFRPVKGAPPPVISTAEKARCVIASSDVSFEGIRFYRRTLSSPKNVRRPSLLWIDQAKNVRLSRCRIEIPWRPDGSDRTSMGCIALGRVDHCLIEDCELVGLSATAIHIGSNINNSVNIEMRDTLVVSKTALNRDIGGDRFLGTRKFSWTMERCALVTQRGFTHVAFVKGSEQPLDPISLTLKDTLFHTAREAMRFPDGTLELALANVRWKSEDCQIAYGKFFLSCPRWLLKTNAPCRFASIEEAQAAQLAVTDERSQIIRNSSKDTFASLLPLSATSLTKGDVQEALPDTWQLPMNLGEGLPSRR